MTLKELFPKAKIANDEILQTDGDVYVHGYARAGQNTIMVDGWITAAQLRALADWMEGKTDGI